MNTIYEKRLRAVRAVMAAVTLLILFGASTVFGATVDVYVRADTFSKTLADGTAVTMWGYAGCTDGTFTTCGAATVPGPAITAAEGDTLNIHVRNNLTGPITEPTSVIVQGQMPTLVPGSFPVWTDGTAGPRTSADQRVRSFTTETPVSGTTTYTWTGLSAGTYLYQSGTHPSVQVQMGLYGPLTVASGSAGQAYDDPATAFDNQVVLLFSEIDPELHYSIESGLYGTPPPPPPAMPIRGQRTSAEDYHPEYFLINGESYTPGLSPVPAGTAGQRILLRFLNAGLLEKTPTLQGHMTVIAEDGNLYPYAKEQYSLLLSAGKTMDAILTPDADGYIAVTDRSLNLTNTAVSPGGDRIYLQIGAATATLTVAIDGTGTGTITAKSLPGGIDCGLDCSEAYIPGTQVRLSGDAAPGSLLTNWSGGGCGGLGDCIVTMTADATVTGTFTAFSAMQVLAPAKGDIIPAGSSFTVWWGAPANAVTFKISYSLNNGTTWKNVDNGKGVVGNEYFWSVPEPGKTKTNCRIRVVGFNAAGKKIGSAMSKKFTISVP